MWFNRIRECEKISVSWSQPNPGIPNPDIPNPDIPNPDLPYLDIPNPDIPNPDILNPDIPTPYISKPNITNLDVPNPDISNPKATQCCRPWIIQTWNSVRSNNLSLRYQRFTTPGCKDRVIRKSEFCQRLNSFY